MNIETIMRDKYGRWHEYLIDPVLAAALAQITKRNTINSGDKVGLASLIEAVTGERVEFVQVVN